jgi:hypothetical protein
MIDVDTKILNKILAKPIYNTLKRPYTMIKLLSFGDARIVLHMQICKYNTPHKQNQAQKQPVQLN